MKSEWRVTSQYIGGDKIYAVYRLRDIAATDHSGNREYYFGGHLYPTRDAAEMAAQRLNEKESGGEE